ncbi:MAG: MaoC family dehydratase [Acetobacterales bacterium]
MTPATRSSDGALRHAHSLVAGDSFEPLSFSVSAELNQQYLLAQEDFDRRYIVGVGGRPPQVHPALLLSMSAHTKSPDFVLAPGTGSIMARQESRFLAPAFVGSTLSVSWTVVEVYEKRGRPYQVTESVVVDEAGETLLVRRSHLIYSLERKDG